MILFLTTEYILMGRITQPNLSSLTRQPFFLPHYTPWNYFYVQSQRDKIAIPLELAPLRLQEPELKRVKERVKGEKVN